jgi:gluconate 2-dehydrogenase gamma chain
MTDPNRRDVLKFLLAAPLAPFAISALDVERASAFTRETIESLAERGQQFKPKFFTAAEWRTVRRLADLVIPRDDRSGSATDAAVPEFMDFMMGAYPTMQKWMRDGLAWLDTESTTRYSRRFVSCTHAQRTAILDDIAWPKRARDDVRAGVEFFNRFRDLTASGFWSSRMGVQDLRYQGNTALAEWPGCPPAALRKLGVSYRKRA